jgi:hypothetical protein
MRFGFRYVLLCVFSLVVAGVSAAHAQSASWGELAVSAARLDYDLSGVGNAPGLAVRATRNLSSNVSLEFGGLFAKPDQQFGPSTLFMPEAQLRYRWNTGRVSPHVGGGLGTALVRSPFHTDWDPTMSVAAGTSVRLTDRLSAVGELRLRGHEWRFTGTTTELAAGLAWRLPSF